MSKFNAREVATAIKFVVMVTYHQDVDDIYLFLKEGDDGKICETSRMGDASFYSTGEYAQERANRYVQDLLEHNSGAQATLDVMSVHLHPTLFGTSTTHVIWQSEQI